MKIQGKVNHEVIYNKSTIGTLPLLFNILKEGDFTGEFTNNLNITVNKYIVNISSIKNLENEFQINVSAEVDMDIPDDLVNLDGDKRFDDLITKVLFFDDSFTSDEIIFDSSTSDSTFTREMGSFIYNLLHEKTVFLEYNPDDEIESEELEEDFEEDESIDDIDFENPIEAYICLWADNTHSIVLSRTLNGAAGTLDELGDPTDAECYRIPLHLLSGTLLTISKDLYSNDVLIESHISKDIENSTTETDTTFFVPVCKEEGERGISYHSFDTLAIHGEKIQFSAGDIFPEIDNLDQVAYSNAIQVLGVKV